MSNDSSTGGVLQPAGSPAPLEGLALFIFLQNLFVAICGLPGTAFFIDWQLEPANMPAVGTDWAAFGIMNRSNKKFAFIQHYPAVGATPGYDQFQTHEEMEILVSFFGPDADTYAALLRDGLYIPQNREPLTLAGMGLIDTGDVRTVPSLTKAQWLYRVDLPVRIRRAIVRNYPILDLTGYQGTMYLNEVPPEAGDELVVPIVLPPAP